MSHGGMPSRSFIMSGGLNELRSKLGLDSCGEILKLYIINRNYVYDIFIIIKKSLRSEFIPFKVSLISEKYKCIIDNESNLYLCVSQRELY
jgi:ADP-heptose:LPS heptosyltransferase